MRTHEIDTLMCVGDHVIDRMDDDRIRQIESIHDHGDGTASVNMVDGGAMALSEISFDDIRLESEVA